MKNLLVILFFSLLLLIPSLCQAQNSDEERQKLFVQILPYVLSKKGEKETICITTKGKTSEERTLIKGRLTQFDTNTVTILDTQDKTQKTIDFNNIYWMSVYSVPAEMQLNDNTVVECWINGFSEKKISFDKVENLGKEAIDISQVKEIKPGVTKQMKIKNAKYNLTVATAVIINIFSLALTGNCAIQQ